MGKISFWKKGLSLILSIGIIQISFDYTLFKIYAEEVNFDNAVAEYCEEHPLDGYLLMQEQEDTGVMEPQLEAELNAQGVFDDEIMNLSEDEISNLEQAEKVCVVTQYIEYKYIGNEANVEDISVDNQKQQRDKNEQEKRADDSVSISENQNMIDELLNTDILEDNAPEDYEVKVMSDEEVDKLIQELYFNDESAEESALDKILIGIGVKSQNVYASYGFGSSHPNATSYMKKSLLVTQIDGKVNIVFTCKWLKEPANRLNDILEISWTGGRRILNESKYQCNAKITYDKVTYMFFKDNYAHFYKPTIEKFEKVTKDCTDSLEQNWTDKIARIPFNLPNDKQEYGSLYNRYIIPENMTLQVSFWLYREGGGIDVSAEYCHQKKDFDFNLLAGIGLAIGTIRLVLYPVKEIGANILTGAGVLTSAGTIVSISKYYEACGGNRCQVSFNYK